MEVLIISMLIIAGLILFIIEVFLIPGISVAGIASACSLLYAIYYAFDSLGTQAGITIIGITGITIWFMKGKTVDKLALKQTLDYKPNPLKGVDIHVGDIGTTITRLTLIGNAEINGHILEVQSADGFIDEKTPIKVCRITPNTIYVQSIQ